MIYHIRKKLRKSTSTQWYLDKSDRFKGTACGAPATDHDIIWHHKIYSFNGWECCPDCRKIKGR